MSNYIFFGIVVLLSCGVIYAVEYQNKQERIRMRKGILRELREDKELRELIRKRSQ